MTPSDKRLLRERAEKATRGPWCYESVGEKCTDIFIGQALLVDDKKDAAQWKAASGRLDATAEDGTEIEYYREGVAYIDDTCSSGNLQDNAAFIAAAHPAAVIELLDQIEKLEAKVVAVDACRFKNAAGKHAGWNLTQLNRLTIPDEMEPATEEQKAAFRAILSPQEPTT